MRIILARSVVSAMPAAGGYAIALLTSVIAPATNEAESDRAAKGVLLSHTSASVLACQSISSFASNNLVAVITVGLTH
ncbi:hypothetical protein [Nostoc sp.]|uniref:hypothetical protein n=1 Tax=Nostoc sp. TaxID=1180 RepID=UPI002FFC0A53